MEQSPLLHHLAVHLLAPIRGSWVACSSLRGNPGRRYEWRRPQRLRTE